MRLFYHLKNSGNSLKSADLALSVGKSFMHLGLNSHSIHVYEAVLDMWRTNTSSGDDTSIAGFSLNVIDSLEESEMISIIKLQTALGQAFGTLGQKKDSAHAFQDALEVRLYDTFFFCDSFFIWSDVTKKHII